MRGPKDSIFSCADYTIPDKRHDYWIETVAPALPDGPRFHLSTRWFTEWTTFFYGTPDGFISRWISANAKPDWIAVDVGMNFAFFSCFLAQRCFQVHGFEPVPWLADRAEANVNLNKFANVFLNRIALSNQIGEAELHLPSSADANWGKSSLLRELASNTTHLRVPTDTLDHYVQTANLPRLDFIKIDVEGAEHLVLQGSRNSLERLRPAAIFERNDDSFAACRDVLFGRVFRVQGRWKYIADEFGFR